MKKIFHHFSLYFLVLLFSCNPGNEQHETGFIALTGANIFTGAGTGFIHNGILVVREGRVVAAGPRDAVRIPSDAVIINIKGKYIIPGLINSHGHVGDVKGIEPGHYSSRNIQDVLETYAWYGITTVVSLGGDRVEAEPFRAVVDTVTAPGRARLYIAGTIVTGDTPKAADSVVDADVKMGVDLIKIRVDDNLGTTEKMQEEIYHSVIQRAHGHNLELAAHLYYLDDALSLLNDGADFIAHSVRDRSVNPEFIAMMKKRGVCYCPTLTRELSTFVYSGIPDFFNDPFFLAKVDSSVISPLEEPESLQQFRDSRSAAIYRNALDTAMKNLEILSDSGIVISMGTDSGMPLRFPGFFEHLEMQMMQEAGMSPLQILIAATRNPAHCLNLKHVGTLEPGNLADFIILDKDPAADIKNIRSIFSVWIGGKKISR